jgi:hypothetical protein
MTMNRYIEPGTLVILKHAPRATNFALHARKTGSNEYERVYSGEVCMFVGYEPEFNDACFLYQGKILITNEMYFHSAFSLIPGQKEKEGR